MDFGSWCEDLAVIAEQYSLHDLGSLERFRGEFEKGWTPEQVFDYYLRPAPPLKGGGQVPE